MGTTADKLNAVLASKTAIKNAIVAKGVAVPDNTPLSQYASKISSITTGSGGSAFTPWVRPAEFLTLAPNVDGVEKISILMGVENLDFNIIAFSLICNGSYNVDWGDGSTETILSGEIAYHNYSFTNPNLNSDTLLKYNFKQSVIIITGTNITEFDTQHIDKTLSMRTMRLSLSAGSTQRKIKSLNINLPYCTVMRLSVYGILNGSIKGVVKHQGIYDINFGQLAMNDYSYLCANMTNVRKIIFEKPIPQTIVDYSHAFYSCELLENLPISNFIGESISCYNTYGWCKNIVGDHTINISSNSITTTYFGTRYVEYMFNYFGQYSKIAPKLNIHIECNQNYKITGFFSYVNMHPDSTLTFGGLGKILSMESFANNSNITKTLVFDDSLCTNFSASHNTCLALTSADAIYTFASATTVAGIYYGCRNLKTIAHNFNLTSNCTNAYNLVGGCSSLTSLPILTGNLTNASLGGIYSKTRIKEYTFDINCKSFSGIFDNTHNFDQNISVVNSKIRSTTTPSPQSVVGAYGTFISVVRFQCDIDFSFNIDNALLSADALNEMFTALPIVASKVVNIAGNPGIYEPGYDPTIATNKGWTIVE